MPVTVTSPAGGAKTSSDPPGVAEAKGIHPRFTHTASPEVVRNGETTHHPGAPPNVWLAMSTSSPR
jgi:hypothetical protein